MTRNEGKGFALVTGASWGIGTEFARQLAREGYDLILTARSEDRLKSLQADLASTGRTIHTVPADLSAPQEIQALQTRVQSLGVEVELLVNNAGFGSAGSFAKQEVSRELSIVDVNVRSVVELSHFFVQGMRQRGHGGIINVASVVGHFPFPFMATYAATKAFVVSFSQSLYYENRPKGVHVMVCCPGTTDTNFFQAANMKPVNRRMQTAEAVARETMQAYRKKRSMVITGGSNRAMLSALKLIPRFIALNAMGKIMQPREI